MKFYQIAADSGILLAKLNLGEKYLVGMGIEQSYEKAFQNFLECSNQGITEDANAFLGYMYERGLYPPMNLKVAIYYYSTAYNHFALARLGFFYLRKAHSLWVFIENRKSFFLLKVFYFLKTEILKS